MTSLMERAMEAMWDRAMARRTFSESESTFFNIFILTNDSSEPVQGVSTAILHVHELLKSMEMLSLPPLLLDDVPYLLNGIQHGAVGGQEHVAEAMAI